MSRARKLLAEGKPLPLPDVGLVYLVEILFKIGPVLPNGMGAAPITQGEIRHWMHNNGIELTPWESETLRNLSQDYAAEGNRATKPDAAPPWTAFDPVSERRARTAESVRNVMRGQGLARDGAKPGLRGRGLRKPSA